jgi:hypothetical protein
MKYYECPNCYKQYALIKKMEMEDVFYCDDCGSLLNSLNIIKINGESKYMIFYRWCCCFASSVLFAGTIISVLMQNAVVLLVFFVFALLVYLFGLWIVKSMIRVK